MSQFEYRLSRLTSEWIQPNRLSSSQLISAMPIKPVSSTPFFRLMRRGATFWKSLVGDTTFAAVFVAMVARMMMTMERITHTGLLIRPISVMGSEIVSPTSCAEAEVMTTPRPANMSIVNGRPMIWPTIWLFWDFANRLKSGMLSDSVAHIREEPDRRPDHRPAVHDAHVRGPGR